MKMMDERQAIWRESLEAATQWLQPEILKQENRLLFVSVFDVAYHSSPA